jgi:hypothetical protein
VFSVRYWLNFEMLVFEVCIFGMLECLNIEICKSMMLML